MTITFIEFDEHVKKIVGQAVKYQELPLHVHSLKGFPEHYFPLHRVCLNLSLYKAYLVRDWRSGEPIDAVERGRGVRILRDDVIPV